MNELYEVATAVEQINTETHPQHGDSVTWDEASFYELKFSFTGDWAGVAFLGIPIWDNVELDIPWAEDGNTRTMKIYDFLLAERKKVIEKVKSIRCD